MASTSSWSSCSPVSAEAGRDQNRTADALLPDLFQRLRDEFCRDGEDRDVYVARHVGDGRV